MSTTGQLSAHPRGELREHRSGIRPQAAPESTGHMPSIMTTTFTRSGTAVRSRLLRIGLQAFGALLASLLVAVSAAQAQSRPIPEQARTGILVLGVFPEARLDGKPVRLGAGARVYDQRNLIVTPASIKDARHRVAFVTGPQNEIVTAWILTNAEIDALRARQRRSR
jgi:hypothetical protein